MNKKKLSVVMAGAMLASSVAPVLAAETTADKKYEASASDLGLVKKGVREFLATKTFHMADKNFAGESVYYFTTNLDNTHRRNADDGTIENLTAGQKLYIWSEGFKADDKGNYFSTEKNETTSKLGKYTLEKMLEVKDWFNGTTAGGPTLAPAKLFIKGIDVDETNKVLKVQLVNGKTLEYTTDSYIVAFEKPMAGGYEIAATADNAQYVDGFVEKTVSNTDESKDIANELLAEVTITPGGYNLSVDDLYDGLFLTEKGQEFFTMIKEAKSMKREYKVLGTNGRYEITADNQVTANITKDAAGNYNFYVTLGKKGQLSAEKYSITGTNEKNVKRLATWLIKPQARVDILAGSNRYETAANIAREYAGLTGKTVSKMNEANIVLVNGNALVDGLAAAPLAASLENKTDSLNAPILLTESDELPKATKAYLKEVLANVQVGGLNKVTVHLVGGETVLNKSLERELKALGFNVERYGGDNREATSLAVAEAMEDLKTTTNKVNSDKAFIVGANGEADAMSIASVAAETKTPIIVAKNGGISEDALYELRGKKATIVGGKTVVSEADYNAIKAEADGVARIAGSNRQATNAEIIAKYYKNGFVGAAKNVVVAKDGQNNKSELVDALAAANMASEKKAPIVLATNKLSKAQINALELNAKNSYALYQVGHGVARDVVKTIAENLGLSNR